MIFPYISNDRIMLYDMSYCHVFTLNIESKSVYGKTLLCFRGITRCLSTIMKNDKRGSHICCQKHLLIIWLLWVTLNDTVNDRIPQYCQEYNDTHKCSINKGSYYCIYYIQCMICCSLFIWLWCNCKSYIRVILHVI